MASKPKPTPSVRGEFIETETGNKISRRASILGPKHIILAGKCVIQHDVVVHGDLVRPAVTTSTSTSTSRQPSTDADGKSTEAPSKDAGAASSSSGAGTSINLGRYVFISQGSVLHPPSRQHAGVATYYPLRISDNVFIGAGTVVKAAEIRSGVHIGAKCVIGNFVIIKENVKVLDGTVLPAHSVWASGTVVAGRPGRVVGEIGEGWGGGGSEGKGGLAEEGVGVRARERWASVGNKR